MTLLVFALSFVMAFLLFAVQPMATKMVLPSLGGTPAVWNTAMLTFQLLLLVGYGYAHFLHQRITPRGQRMVHGLLIALSFAVLPLSVTLESNEALMENPIPQLTWALVSALGLPFFVLAATAPLLQAWVSSSDHRLRHSPYVLYSASNLGSLSALLGYVALVEPNLTLLQQSYDWSLLYMASGALLLLASWRLLPRASTASHADAAVVEEKLSLRLQVLWIFLAFLGSALSLSVTSFLTMDMAAIPLLWVLPLALYLLSFVDAFRMRPLCVPFAMRVAPLIGMMLLILYAMQYFNMVEQYAIHLFGAAILMFGVHGWLARAKPNTAHLTRFYFCLALGGALGGALNALVAPLLFTDIVEYPLTVLVASLTLFLLGQQAFEAQAFRLRDHAMLLLKVVAFIAIAGVNIYLVATFVMYGDWMLPWQNTDYKILLRAACAAALLSLVVQRRYASAYYGCAVIALIILMTMNHRSLQTTIFKERNFFGVTRVDERNDDRLLFHNTTLHSSQKRDGRNPPTPTSYYSNLASAFAAPAAATHPFAVVGLGAGTMQCYAKEDQEVDFIDINPTVARVANNPEYFTFLHDCPGKHRLLIGDGRITLAAQEDGKYGVIVLDAFSSDAIPAHLLTTQAFEIYLKKLAPQGVLLVHITNRYLNLAPQIAAQASAFNLTGLLRNFGHSYWVILARSADDLAPVRAVDDQWQTIEDAGQQPWTDHYVNIFPYLMLGRTQPINL